MDGQKRSRGRDAAIASLATREHGVVSNEQLREIGLTQDEIDNRVAAGRLHRLYRGVYAVGHRALTQHGRWMAAVLASGPGAALSHRSAAGLWELRADKGVPETTAARSHRTRRGLKVHHSSLQFDEVTARGRIPVTTPARTLLDLAAVLDRRELERAFRQAEFHRRADRGAIERLLGRYPGRRGVAALRAVVGRVRPGEITKSNFEIAFLAFCDKHRIPRPATNVRMPWGEVDAVWRNARLIVELDPRSSHDTPGAFERDRARDRAATLAGWRVVRVTPNQLGRALAADLRALLRA